MDIRKAILLASQTEGTALIPEDLDPVLVEYLFRVAPILRRIDKQEADGKTHEINRRTAVPTAWFADELAVLTSAHSTYERMSVQIKILRTPQGGVSGFERAASKRFIDSLEAELLGMVEALADLYEWSMVWACADDLTAPVFLGDAMQFTGLVPYIFHDAYAAAHNVIDAAGAVCTLSHLDDVLNAAEGFRGVQRDPKVFMASRQMISRIGGLETHIYRIPETVEFVAGWSVTAYKHVPLVPTDFVSPDATTTSPSLLGVVADPGTGTGLPNGQYYYRISSVTRTGEQVAGAAGVATIAGGPHNMALGPWVADANAMLYLVWRGAVGGGSAAHADLSLIDIIPAKTYTAGLVTGNVTTYTDTGKARITTVHPLATGEQNIVLMNLHPRRGSGLLYLPSELWEDTQVPAELAAEAGNIKPLFGLVELARTRSAWDFQLEGYAAMKVPWARLHGVIRRVKYA